MDETGPVNSKRRRLGRWSIDNMRMRWVFEVRHTSGLLAHGSEVMHKITAEVAVAQREEIEIEISDLSSGSRFRVVTVHGSGHSISELADRAAKYQGSPVWDLMILLPNAVMGRVIGSCQHNLKDIGEQSGARLVADARLMPESDERILHVCGNGPSLRIALYHLAETLAPCGRILDGGGYRLWSPDTGSGALRSLSEATPQTQTARTSQKLEDAIAKGADPDAANTKPLLVQPRYKSTVYSGDLHSGSMHVALSVPAGATKEEHAGPDQSAHTKGSLSPLNINLDLPPPGESGAVRTAFEVARESRQSYLRQIVRLSKISEELMDNISRVTEASVRLVEDYCDTDDSDGGVVLELSGPPEENLLALYIVYRWLCKHT